MIKGMDAETIRRYAEVREKVDEMLWAVASLSAVLHMLREIPGPIEMDNHAIGRIGGMIETNVYDIFDLLENSFAARIEVERALEKRSEE